MRTHPPFRDMWGLGVLLISPLIFAQTQGARREPAPSKAQPLLKIDLRVYGYSRQKPTWASDHLSLAFIDTDHFLVGWTTLDNPSDDQKKGPMTPVPAHLHALVVNVRNGKKENLKEWPSSSFFSDIRPVANEKFLICTGAAVRLLSVDFNLVREKSLASPGPCTSEEVSPSGRSFSVNSGAREEYQGTLLDSESFESIATWSNEVRDVHFTDSLLVGNCGPQFREVCLCKLNHRWERFDSLEFDKQMKDRTRKRPFFVNDSTLVVIAGKEMAVLTVGGASLFQSSLPVGYLFGQKEASNNSDRFAIVETRMRGVTNESLDMYAFASDDHVTVFSVSERRAIYAVEVKGTSPWSPWIAHRNQLALSRDGMLLAVFDDGVLKVYALPS